jgi:hypothetical protein
MTTQIRHLIAEALDSTTVYSLLPGRCESYGLEPGEVRETIPNKKQYVLSRLEKLSDEKVLQVAKLVLADVADDRLQSAVEQISQPNQLVSVITRRRVAEALNGFSLTGKTDLVLHWRKAVVYRAVRYIGYSRSQQQEAIPQTN